MAITMNSRVSDFLIEAGVSTRLYRIQEVLEDKVMRAATVGDLCAMTERDLLQIDQLGKKSIRELQGHLKRFGFRLKGAVIDVDSATSLSRAGLSRPARDWLSSVGVRTLMDLAALVRGGRSVPGTPGHHRTVPDLVWKEAVRVAQEQGLVYAVDGVEATVIALVMQLADRWDACSSLVLGDWCEERGLHAVARDLRLDPPDRRTRAALHALACCLGVATIAVPDNLMAAWIRVEDRP